MIPVTELLEQTPYSAYSYSYPHKTAYRKLSSPIALRQLWETEQRDSLFLYLHIPFCEMRCGFCNLFTTANPSVSVESSYISALKRQGQAVKAELGDATITRLAIGGGTPTYLKTDELQQIFDLVEQVFKVDLQQIPISVETSPLTSEVEKLLLLRQRGVDRMSIGVQSFREEEVRAVGRSQQTATVISALHRIKNLEFPTLNIDLMYGLPGQTISSWMESLQTALSFAPEELYLYPLYIRPLTGIEQKGKKATEDIRLTCYRIAREILLSSGYRQISMRMFQSSKVPKSTAPTYCCQTDGMIGLGSGARSYTRNFHYSSEYAVGSSDVREIINSYLAKNENEFAVADYGVALNDDERYRRFIIQSLLQIEGLSLLEYKQKFASDIFAKYPLLRDLIGYGLATEDNEYLRLTATGLERSDLIGPWLYSSTVQALMQTYEIR